MRALRGLPVADGLLVELHGGEGLSLDGLHRPRFLSDDVLILEAIRFHPSVQAPELRRKDRLRWHWTRGEATLEPNSYNHEFRRDRFASSDRANILGPLLITERDVGDSSWTEPLSLPKASTS